MRIGSFILAAGVGLALAQGAQAQDASTASTVSDNGTSFRGFRAEIQGGGTRFQSQGQHDDKLSWGGAVGFDGVIAQKFVVGPEFGYWHGRGENVTAGVNGGTIAHKSFQELNASIRAGYLVRPNILVYGIGGYVDNEQRKAYSGTATEAGFYNHFHTVGYQLGGGAEYSITPRFYTGLGYRYNNYNDHTISQRVFASAGVRF